MVPILVVDDSMADLRLAEMELTRTKVLNPVVLLNSANQCLEYFAERANKFDPPPCLGFIDLVMPDRSGVDLLKALREIPSAQSSAFVILSGLADHKMISQGYAEGARTFLTKPISYEEVRRTLTRLPEIEFVRRRNGFELVMRDRAVTSSTRSSDLARNAVE